MFIKQLKHIQDPFNAWKVHRIESTINKEIMRISSPVQTNLILGSRALGKKIWSSRALAEAYSIKYLLNIYRRNLPSPS